MNPKLILIHIFFWYVFWKQVTRERDTSTNLHQSKIQMSPFFENMLSLVYIFD